MSVDNYQPADRHSFAQAFIQNTLRSGVTGEKRSGGRKIPSGVQGSGPVGVCGQNPQKL